MARARTIAADLARLLNSAAQPIYLIDDDQILVFANSACLDWLGRTADELAGRRCAYHSGAEPASAGDVTAGLCPSPAVLGGQEMVSTVTCLANDGRVRRRRARFIPLGAGPGDTTGLIALVDPHDLSESESPLPEGGETEAARLHEQIREFRLRFGARFRVDRLIGNHPATRRARAQVAVAAQSKASVLIVGPPGSGRRHVGAAIHYGSPSESAGSMIPLACSVLGADLIHSTVGALATGKPEPGEIRPRTLLLNDADQLPIEIQAEVAAVLSGKSFPLRLIATATQSPSELARQGKYRQDLASVLSTIVIELPPLAQRREDVPLLAQLLLEEINARGAKQVAGFSSEALDRLDAYPWPGNVDELAQMVAEAHKRTQGVRIEVADLPKRIHWAADAAAHPRPPEETIVLDDFLAQVERELIQRAMARAKGNKAKAARLLGMTRPRLYRRLVQLGLEK